jgi:hypothetical protein
VLAEQQIFVRELAPVHADLESVFLQLTRNESLSTPPPELPTPPNVPGKHAAAVQHDEPAEETQ